MSLYVDVPELSINLSYVTIMKIYIDQSSDSIPSSDIKQGLLEFNFSSPCTNARRAFVE